MKLAHCGLVLALIAVVARGDDDEGAVQAADLASMFGQQAEPTLASPDAHTEFAFVKFHDRAFPSGQSVDLLLGLGNTGSKTIRVSSLSASLVAPNQFDYYVENYTNFDYHGFPVAPGEQGTFLYSFMPNPNIEPAPFGLTARVYYSDETGRQFVSHYFNDTVAIVEATGPMDAETLFTYIALFAIIGGGGYFAYLTFSSPTGKAGKGGKSSSSASTPLSPVTSPTKANGASNGVSDDWLDDLQVKKKNK